MNVERLYELFDYDIRSGLLTWKLRIGDDNYTHHFNQTLAGKRAGTYGGERKYGRVSADGQSYATSHVIWAMCSRSWPKKLIDHIDGDTGNDRITNLREATVAQNSSNKPGWNKANRKGAYWTGKVWTSTIMKDGVSYYLGIFETAEEAHAAYCAKAAELHGTFANFQSRPN